MVYLKFDRWLSADLVRKLEADGVISWIKYAVVLDDPRQDDYLRELLQVFPAADEWSAALVNSLRSCISTTLVSGIHQWLCLRLSIAESTDAEALGARRD